MIKKFGLLAIVAGVIGLMVLVFVLGNKETPKTDLPLVGEKIPLLTAKHINPGDAHEPYNSNPPSSGDHYPQPAKWEVIGADKVEADERYVHNLEHGGIWITYRPDLPTEQITQLQGIFQTLPKSTNFDEVKAVMTPRAANDHAISLVAWGYVEHLDSPDPAKIKEFYLSHVDKGPELVP